MNLRLENEYDFDLRDIFETIWAGKFIVVLSGIVSVFFSVLSCRFFLGSPTLLVESRLQASVGSLLAFITDTPP